MFTMDFIQQAYKGNTEWYWYLVTLVVVFIFWQIIGVAPLSLVAFSHLDGNLNEFMKAASDGFASIGINSNLYLVLALLTLIMGLIGLILAVKFVHQRLIKTITTSRNKIDWKRVFFAFVLWAVISIGFIVLSIFLEPENLVWNFKPIPFFILLLISIVLIPLQTSFEELFMRGYLMQGIGVLAKNRWVPLIVTSLVFGLLHGANPEVAKLGWGVMVFYIGTGLMFGITTLMDEGTEIALGMHASNNIVAALFVTTDWTAFRTDALYIDTSEPSLGWETYIPVFVFYPIILFILSKKYNWSNWQEKLFGKVEKPELIAENN